MYTYELYDILFLIQSLQNPEPSFPFMNYVSFSTTSTTSGAYSKRTYQCSHTNLYQHSFFCQMVCLWKTLPPFDLSLSLSTIKHQLSALCRHTSPKTLTHKDRAHFTWYVLVTSVPNRIIPPTSIDNSHFSFSDFLSSPTLGSQ